MPKPLVLVCTRNNTNADPNTKTKTVEQVLSLIAADGMVGNPMNPGPGLTPGTIAVHLNAAAADLAPELEPGACYEVTFKKVPDPREAQAKS